MWGMKDLNISIGDTMDKNFITLKMLDKAIILAKEPFWSYADALQVVDEISKKNYAIVGVELYEQIDGSPKWIATSNYSYGKKIVWIEYSKRCNESARDFIETNREHKGGLFNFSYIQEGEI